jgi:hypothetical protein
MQRENYKPVRSGVIHWTNFSQKWLRTRNRVHRTNETSIKRKNAASTTGTDIDGDKRIFEDATDTRLNDFEGSKHPSLKWWSSFAAAKYYSMVDTLKMLGTKARRQHKTLHVQLIHNTHNTPVQSQNSVHARMRNSYRSHELRGMQKEW